MKSREEDLDDINDFATDFTHDPEADGSLQELDDAKLKNYAKRTLVIPRGAGDSTMKQVTESTVEDATLLPKLLSGELPVPESQSSH
jgi:hypothetical protein